MYTDLVGLVADTWLFLPACELFTGRAQEGGRSCYQSLLVVFVAEVGYHMVCTIPYHSPPKQQAAKPVKQGKTWSDCEECLVPREKALRVI